MMKFTAMLPEGLRSVFEPISPAALDVVAWKDVVQEARLLLTHWAKKTGLDTVMQTVEPWLPAEVAWAAPEMPVQPLSAAKAGLSPAARTEIGELLLYTYFVQFRAAAGPLLDLRLGRFSTWSSHLSDVAPAVKLFWQPSGLFSSMAPAFKQHMVALYRGFYDGSPAAMDLALDGLGLSQPGWSDAARTELHGLLKRQFGAGDQTAVRFRLSDFTKSFHELFLFLSKNRVKLTADFMLLGVYLVTLYTALEELGEAYDVRAMALKALDPALQPRQLHN